jgi:hypothetical protein
LRIRHGVSGGITTSAVDNGIATASLNIYTEEELNAMTIAQIKALAEELGYTITASKKADIVTEFLSQQ